MDTQNSSDQDTEHSGRTEKGLTEQTVTRDGVSVKKSASEQAASDIKPGGDRTWRCSLTIESEHDFPVAVQIVEDLPAAVSVSNIAILSDAADGWELRQGQAVYSCFVEPGASVRTTYILYTNLLAPEAFRNVPTIAKIQPVDPATVSEGDDAPVWRGGGDAGMARPETSSEATNTSDIATSPIEESADSHANRAIRRNEAGNSTESRITSSIASRIERSERAAADSDVLVPRQSDTRPVVSVVMPTMNEEEGIAECIDRVIAALTEIGYSAEIIVSDSSEDATPEIAARKGAQVVTPDREGYGYAYRYAFERVRGEYIVIGDADTTYDFSEMPKMFRRMAETDADIVMGSRLAGEIKTGAMPPLHQYVGNPLLTKFLNMFYNVGVSDAHSGFRLIKRDALAQLNLQSEGMEFASEMIMQAGERGLSIEEVPITYHERKGEATLDSFRDGWRHVRFMLVNAPGYLFTTPAVVFAVLGVGAMTASLVGVQLNGIQFGTYTMIAGSLSTILAFNTGSLALFSSIAGNPIREPNDALTQTIDRRFQLEHGATIGLGLFAVGTVYTAYLVLKWVDSGFNELPLVPANLLAFTLIMLGIQTVFYSFFFSMLGTQMNRARDGE